MFVGSVVISLLQCEELRQGRSDAFEFGLGDGLLVRASTACTILAFPLDVRIAHCGQRTIEVHARGHIASALANGAAVTVWARRLVAVVHVIVSSIRVVRAGWSSVMDRRAMVPSPIG